VARLVAHFAGEARVATVDDMRKTGEAKRVTLLVSLLHQQRVEARDEVVTMFCKRMAALHKKGRERLEEQLLDLRSISDADPDGQLWAAAMASTLAQAHHAAIEARERGAEALDQATLTQIRSHYHGALARGHDDNQGQHTTLADKARTLITFATNVFGVVEVITAFLSLLARSAAPRVVNGASTTASLSLTGGRARLRRQCRAADGLRQQQGRIQHDHLAARGGVARRPHLPPHQGQLRDARLRRHRAQRLPGHPFDHRGRWDPRRASDPARRRPQRRILQ
jgi:hypothetical protein